MLKTENHTFKGL
jgi:hypothetical protein